MNLPSLESLQSGDATHSPTNHRGLAASASQVISQQENGRVATRDHDLSINRALITKQLHSDPIFPRAWWKMCESEVGIA